jgi:hypothetical protein
MRSIVTTTRPSYLRVLAGILSATFALGITVSAPASAATKEVDLAARTEAFAYCQSGKMPASDIAYIAGGARRVQYGPNRDCRQARTVRIIISKAIFASGKRIAECNLSPRPKAIAYCEGGGMGEQDIAYVAGKIGKSIYGPGYGCVLHRTDTVMSKALCK